MIRIYDKEEPGKKELAFKSLGLGNLDETIAGIVIEEINGKFELEMEYPISGRHYDKIQLRNIIFCKPNMYDEPQPFRIYSITKPINGVITINAEHASYDANGITILPKREDNKIVSFGNKETFEDEEGYFLDTILNDTNNGIEKAAAVQSKNYFKLYRGSDKDNVFKKEGYSIGQPMNLRSIFGGVEGSLLNVFKGEWKFDKYSATLHDKRGQDRGITIRYGKNMTDLEQETDGTGSFTAIYPFYSKSYTETHTSTRQSFQDVYIRENTKRFRVDWLSTGYVDGLKFGGISLDPIKDITNILVDAFTRQVSAYVGVRVKTPNSPGRPEDYNNIFIWKKNTDGTQDPEDPINLFKVRLILDVDGEIIGVKTLDDVPIIHKEGDIYIVQDELSDLFGRNIIYDAVDDIFIEYSADGFYVQVKDASDTDSLPAPLPDPLPLYPIKYDGGVWVRDNQNGWIYIQPRFPKTETISEEKYIYVDLKTFTPTSVESPYVFEDGVLYLNSDIKDLDDQKILTLNLSEHVDESINPELITQDLIFDKAEQYLKDNDLSKIKESIKVSFIKLSDSPEYSRFKDLEIVTLGDEINVVYERLGVSSKRRVIMTEYNVLTNRYNEIELGDKVSTISNNIVSLGDPVSSLSNDAEYTNKSYVTKLVAETAEIINASIQNAVIDILQVGKINVSGMLEASTITVDEIVAKLLKAENAQISNVLSAGSVRVRGDISVQSGEITLGEYVDVNGKINHKFKVDRDGNVKISEGYIDIGNGNFRVGSDGIVSATDINISGGLIDVPKINSENINAVEIQSINNVVNRVYFIDNDVFIERKTISAIENREVIFTVNPIFSSPIENGINITVSVTAKSTAGTNLTLWKDTTIIVSVTYYDIHQNMYQKNVTVSIAEDEHTSDSVSVDIYGASSVNSNGIPFPSKITESRVSGTETETSLKANIFGIEYDIVSSGSSPTIPIKILVQTTEPNSEIMNTNDFWYEVD